MSQERSFRKTSSSVGEIWAPQANETNGFRYVESDDANNVIEGYLTEVLHDVGMHNSTVWKVHEVMPDGKLGDVWSIWGDKVLTGELEKEKLGSYIRIVYKGKKAPKGKPALTQPQWTKGNSYHMWDVMVDDGAIPYNQANPGATIKPTTEKAVVQSNQQSSQSNSQNAPVFNSRQRNAGNQTAGGNNAQAGAFNADDDLPF